MTAASVTLQGQTAAEALMVDTGTLTRYGPQTWVESTGTQTRPVLSTPYSGKCRVKAAGFDQSAEAGEEQISRWPFTVSLPVAVVDVQLNDVFTLSAAVDASLIGVPLRVREVLRGTNITARRLGCEEVESP